jgi:hypothetical protein
MDEDAGFALFALAPGAFERFYFTWNRVDLARSEYQRVRTSERCCYEHYKIGNRIGTLHSLSDRWRSGSASRRPE